MITLIPTTPNNNYGIPNEIYDLIREDYRLEEMDSIYNNIGDLIINGSVDIEIATIIVIDIMTVALVESDIAKYNRYYLLLHNLIGKQLINE